MGSITDQELNRADKRAAAAEEAKKLVQHAGNGLADVYAACRANAVSIETVAKLQVIQGYLTEAAVILLEAEVVPKVQLPN